MWKHWNVKTTGTQKCEDCRNTKMPFYYGWSVFRPFFSNLFDKVWKHATLLIILWFRSNFCSQFVRYLSFLGEKTELIYLHCQISQEKMKSRSPVCDTERQRSWQSGSTDFVKTLLLEGIDTLGLLLLLRNRSGINSCYACSKEFNQRRHLS